jgi:hypothetical protein
MKTSNLTLAEIKDRVRRGEALPPGVLETVQRAQRMLAEGLRRLDAQMRVTVDREFGAGTAEQLDDVWEILSGVEIADRILEILAPRLQWKLFTDYSLLKTRADEWGMPEDELRRYFAHLGLRLAASDMNRPQYIKLGSKWVVGADNRKVKVQPEDLLPFEAIRWFVQASKAAATASVTDKPWPRLENDALDRRVVPAEKATHVAQVTFPDGLEVLLMREDEKDATARREIAIAELEAICSRSSRRYRKLAAAVIHYMEVTDAGVTEAMKAVATEEGVTLGNFHTYHYNERKKGRPLPLRSSIEDDNHETKGGDD